mgnify:CR=1 FL=1
MKLRDDDRRLIDTYFKRNYRRGEALDISRHGSWSDRPWNEWKNRTLAMKGWQTDGAPFLTKKFKWIPQGPPRTLLREPGENGGAEIHTSHLEFKVFLQDRIEMVNSGLASPRFLLRDDPNSEYQEYEDTWKKLARKLQSVIFDENNGITKIPQNQLRILEHIDFVLDRKERGGDWDDLASFIESGEEITPDNLLTVLDENSLKSTKEEISRIVVKSLISKSTNSGPGKNQIFQIWTDRHKKEGIIKFYNEESDSNLSIKDFDFVKRKILEDFEMRNDKSVYQGLGLWRAGEEALGKYERLDIHCTGFVLVEALGVGIGRLLTKRIDDIAKVTKGGGMKELKISSSGDTKKVYDDLKKPGVGIIKNGFGKAPHGMRGKSEDVTYHNSILMAYNIVNMLLEQGFLQLRKMTEQEYRDSFMGGQEDKELNRAAWKEYPNLLVFSKTLKDFIDECKVNLDNDENAIYRWMRAPSDRWMYSPPQDHEFRPIWEERENHSNISGTEKENNKEQNIQQTRPRGLQRRYSQKIDDCKPGGFLRPDRRGMVSNHDAYEKWETPRSLPSEKTVQALNSLQSVQWEINLDLLERICVIDLREGNKHTTFLDKNGKPIKESTITKIRIKDCLKEVFFRPDSSQFNRDRKLTLAHVRRIIEHNANVFWHAWSCDFRGRLLPRSTALSPQGNDIDRALIRFKEWKPIGDDGIKWLRIHVYNLMKGVDIEGWIGGVPGIKSNRAMSFEDRDAWAEQNIDKLREIASDFTNYLEELELNKTARSKSEVFQRLAALIELDRVYEEWHSLEEPDWSAVRSGQPIYIDASSNGYQHVSCLLRNRDLAEKVNVIPNPQGNPVDLYDLVAKKARKVELERDNGIWNLSDTGVPAEKSMRDILKSEIPNWSSDDLDRAIEAIFNRSTAKKPTMTRVYGAKDILKSIWGSGGEGRPSWCPQQKDPLTSKEEQARKEVPQYAKDAYESWKGGETDYWPFANSTKLKSKDGKISWEIYRIWREAMDENRWFPVWARGSSLHDALILNLDEDDEVRKAFDNHRNPKLQGEIAKLLGKAMLAAIDDETQDAYTSLEASLKAIIKIDQGRGWKDRFELDKPSNMRGHTKYNISRYSNPDVIIKTTFGGIKPAQEAAKDLIHLHPGPGWFLDDGFEVRNYYLKKHHSDKTRKGAPSHPLSAYKEGLPDWYGKKSSTDILKRIVEVLKDKGIEKVKAGSKIYEMMYLENGQLRVAKKDKPPKRPQLTHIMKELGDLGNEGKEINMLLKHRSHSFPRFHEEESKRVDKGKPGTAFAPNFVHSLDALHMRGTIVKFAEGTPSIDFGFWAVHDAFGTHPSEVERMIRVVKDEFREVHRHKDLMDWIREISKESGLNPDGQHQVVNNILKDLNGKIGDLSPQEIATSDFLVH